MNEIEDSTTRISTLVGAAKQYSQLDRAPFQVVDVHELLDSTLVMLAGKIGDGDHGGQGLRPACRRSRPTPAELNQVWTNLIDNAVQAMDGDGHADHPHRAGRRLRRWSRSATPAPASRTRSRAGSSSRSSPPSRSARAPASAWTSPGGSWSTSTTATCRSSPSPATPGSRSAAAARSSATPHDDELQEEQHDRDRRASTRRCRRAAPAASSATRPAAGGSTCAAAPSAATSAAATPRRPSTPPRTPRPPATRSSAASSRARTGSGTTRTRSSTTARSSPPPEHHPADQPVPGPAGPGPPDWRATCTKLAVVSRMPLATAGWQASRMGIVSPGFTGRRGPATRSSRRASTSSTDFPVLPPGPTPPVQHRRPGVHASPRRPAKSHAGTGRRSPRCRPRTSRSTSTASPSGPSSAPAGAACPWTRSSTARDQAELRAGQQLRRLHDQPAAGRPARRPGLGRLRVRRRAARRPSTAARPGCWSRTCTSGSRPSGCRAST